METAMLVSFVVGVLIFSLVLYVLEVIALWKIFVKAGEDGWKAIIPILNIYVLFKISWDPKFFWFYLGAQVLGGILASSENSFAMTLGSLCSLGAFVLTVIMLYYLSKSFGQGAGFTVGLVLLQLIFLMILGFGGSSYIGNGYEIAQIEKSGTSGSAGSDPMGPSDPVVNSEPVAPSEPAVTSEPAATSETTDNNEPTA